jgi:hypothetical protein
VRFIEPNPVLVRAGKLTAMAVAAVLAACSSTPLPPYSPAPVTSAVPTTPATLAPAAASAPAPLARNWDEYRVHAARMIVKSNAGSVFFGPLPEMLQSIPVLTVQLNPDGSVRNIDVMRTPRFAPETLQMAMRAIRQAAPFGSVAHLPQPWQFNETFLYNNDLKFQIRSLVESR